MVKIIGHRGAAGYAPENTILSFQTAIDIGCDRAELDVRLSKDNEVIVFHDEKVSRMTNRTGFVHKLNLVELKKLELPYKQKIPTLQEVIDYCKGKIDLMIELKSKGTAKPVNKILLENNFAGHVVIISFDVELLQEIKEINPKLKVGLLFKKYSESVWQLAKKIPLDFIGPKSNIVTRGMINKAHKLGKYIYTYNVKDKETGNKLIALGVDEIGTDFPKLFIN